MPEMRRSRGSSYGRVRVPLERTIPQRRRSPATRLRPLGSSGFLTSPGEERAMVLPPADEWRPDRGFPTALRRSLVDVVGGEHVLTDSRTAGYVIDWTGRYRGFTPAVVRPGDTAQVAAVLALCAAACMPVV